MTDQRRLTRSDTDRVLGGVAGGIAEHYGLDPTLVRIGFAVFAIFGGSGVILYLALWVIIPAAEDVDQAPSAVLRDGVAEMREAAQRVADDVRAGWRGAPASPPPAQPPTPPPAAPTTDATDTPQDDLTDD